MNEQEISKIFSLLNEAGSNGTGDYDGDYLMLPREKESNSPTRVGALFLFRCSKKATERQINYCLFGRDGKK